MEARFSVIIPTYNRVAILGRAIQSVLSQTFPAWEIIVVDDGSSDGTRELVESFPQVRYHYQANAGVCAARNKGAEIATGDWLIFLDSDDELLPYALLEFFNGLGQSSKVMVQLAGYIIVKNEIKNSFIPENGRYIGHLSGSFCLKKKLFHRIGGYDPNLRFAENTELFLRIEKKELIHKILKPVMKYYQPNDGGSGNLREMTKSILHILEKHPNLDQKIKFLYHRIVGVNYIRFRKFSEAQSHFLFAIKLYPYDLSTWVRWIVSYFPKLASFVYSSNPPEK